RERPKRWLPSPEQNLLRLQDLFREVRRQLRPLERQADAARRHGDLVAELRALPVHLAGRDIANLKQRLETTLRRKNELPTQERDLKRNLSELDAAVLTTEAQLSAMG